MSQHHRGFPMGPNAPMARGPQAAPAASYGGHPQMTHEQMQWQQHQQQQQQNYGAPFPAQRDGASAPGGPGMMPQGFNQYQGDPRAGADPAPPNLSEMVRWGMHEGAPFFPTRPLRSDAENVAHMPRDYVAILASTEADYVPGTQVARNIQFNTPCILVALNAGVFSTAALAVGLAPLDTFTVQVQYTNGELMQTQPGLGSAICGNAAWPGEIGGNGRFFSAGSSAVINLTPLINNLTIHVALRVMELWAPTNYHAIGAQGR
jgi:hypothetical protein